MFNPRLKELSAKDSPVLHVPIAETDAGWLTKHVVYLLVDVEGATYEKEITIPHNAHWADYLGFRLTGD